MAYGSFTLLLQAWDAQEKFPNLACLYFHPMMAGQHEIIALRDLFSRIQLEAGFLQQDSVGCEQICMRNLPLVFCYE